MTPRLSGQSSIFGVVFFVFKSLLGIERQKKLEKFAILTRKPRSHARILIYRTWPIGPLFFIALWVNVRRWQILLTYKALNGQAPSYITELLEPYTPARKSEILL